MPSTTPGPWQLAVVVGEYQEGPEQKTSPISPTSLGARGRQHFTAGLFACRRFAKKKMYDGAGISGTCPAIAVEGMEGQGQGAQRGGTPVTFGSQKTWLLLSQERQPAATNAELNKKAREAMTTIRCYTHVADNRGFLGRLSGCRIRREKVAYAGPRQASGGLTPDRADNGMRSIDFAVLQKRSFVSCRIAGMEQACCPEGSRSGIR